MYFIENGIKYSLNNTTREASILSIHTLDQKTVRIPHLVNGYPVVSVGGYACNGTDIKRLELPDTIKTIGDTAFYMNENLQELHIYYSGWSFVEGNLFIGMAAFEGSNIKSITADVPKDTFVDKHAFCNCKFLESVDGIHVGNIEAKAFANCENLTRLIFSNAAFWRKTAFTGCKKLEYLDFIGNACDELPKFLQKAQIRCSKGSNVASWKYSGFDVEVVDDMIVELVQDAFISFRLRDYELENVEITNDDFMNIAESVRKGTPMWNAIDECLTDIRATLDEGLEEGLYSDFDTEDEDDEDI